MTAEHEKHPMTVIEENANAIAWHLKVAFENNNYVSPEIVRRHTAAIKEAHDKLDNFYVIRECQP